MSAVFVIDGCFEKEKRHIRKIYRERDGANSFCYVTSRYISRDQPKLAFITAPISAVVNQRTRIECRSGCLLAQIFSKSCADIFA